MKKFLIGFISGAVLCGSLAVVAVEYNIYPNPYKVMVDGKETAIEGYNINDKSYFQLRDIGSAVGFQVGFDAANETVLVSTDPTAVMPDENTDPAPTEPTEPTNTPEPSARLKEIEAKVSQVSKEHGYRGIWEEDGLIRFQMASIVYTDFEGLIEKYGLEYKPLRYHADDPTRMIEVSITNPNDPTATSVEVSPFISRYNGVYGIRIDDICKKRFQEYLHISL